MITKRLATALEAYDPAFSEEIVVPKRNDRLPQVARHTTVTLATGERCYFPWDFKPILEPDAVDLLQPNLSHASGITEVKKSAAAAETKDVVIALHSPLGLVNLAATL